MVSTSFHSGVETTSGVSDPLGTDNIVIGMFVHVTAASGVLPTLIVQLQHSPNGTDWYNVNGVVSASIAGITLTDIIPSTSPQYIADSVRVAWTIGGVSPSFTFTVDLETTV